MGSSRALPDAARQHEHALREVFNGLRYEIKYVIKAGAPWCWMPNGLPPWTVVWQQAQRWLAAGCFEALADDLRAGPRRKATRGQAMAVPSASGAPSCTWRMTAPRLGVWLRLCKPPPARASAWPGSIGGYTGPKAADAAGAHGIELEVARLPDARRGFVLLPRRRVVERPFAQAARFRRLVQDYEDYVSTLADLHLAALTCLMLKQAAQPTRGP